MSDARPEEELGAAVAHGVRWMSAARVTIEILMLVSMVVLTRLISPADFGRFAVALIVAELAMAVPGEGVGSALVQRDRASREHLQAGLFLSLASAVILTGLFLLLARFVLPSIFGTGTADLVRLMTPMFLIAAPSVVPMAILRRNLDFRRLSIIDISTAVTRGATSVALAIAGLNGEALVLGVLAATVVGTLAALCSVPLVLPVPRRSAIRDISGYGGPASLAAMSWIGFRNCDYAIVSARLGVLQAGYYFRAYTLAVEYQRKISVIMYQVAFPVLSRTTSSEQLLDMRARMVRVLTVTLFPFLAILAIVAPIVVPALFGPQWTPAIVPTQILVIAGASTLVIDAVGATLMASGRARATLWYGLGHFLAYGAAVFLVTPLGLAAVAAAAAVVHTAFLFVAYVVMLRGTSENPLSRLWADTSHALVACAGLAAVALPLDLLLTRSGASGLATLVVVAGGGMAGYLLTLRLVFAETWHTLTGMLRALAPQRPAAGRHEPLPNPGAAG